MISILLYRNIESSKEKLRTYITLRMKRFIAKGKIRFNLQATFSFIEKMRNKHRLCEIGNNQQYFERRNCSQGI